MREILFRGKNKYGDNWVYGTPFIFDENCAFIIEDLFSCEEYYCTGAKNVEVIPESVGQYTGICDKNGTKIFEGDIVKHYNHDDDRNKYDVGRIFWSDETYQFIRTSNEMLGCPHLGRDCEYEVIGNIYDNPELLKEREIK